MSTLLDAELSAEQRENCAAGDRADARADAIRAAHRVSVPDPAAALLAALQSILVECAGPGRPYSADSYLPPHLIEAAQAAVAGATS